MESDQALALMRHWACLLSRPLGLGAVGVSIRAVHRGSGKIRSEPDILIVENYPIDGGGAWLEGRNLSTDRETFVSLFHEAFADVWRFSRRRCSSSADADDAAAESFAVAWRRRRDVPTAESRLWLFGIALRVIANQHRSAARQERLRLRLVEGAAATPTGDESPAYDGTLLAALAALSPADRELLIMRSWDELSVSEMAHLLECSPNAVSLRLHKARRRLMVEIEKGPAATGHVVASPPFLEGEM